MVAAATLSTAEGEARAKLSVLFECHGRYLRAYGPGAGALRFGEFRRGLSGPLEELLPGSRIPKDLQGLQLLDEEGRASAALLQLAFEELPLGSAPGLDVDIQHLRSVMRAVSKYRPGTALHRLSPEIVQHCLVMALMAAGQDQYVAGRERLILAPVQKRRAVARLPHVLRQLGVYAEIPADRSFLGWCARCPFCQWTMHAFPDRDGGAAFRCAWQEHRDRGAEFGMRVTDAGPRLAYSGELRVNLPQPLLAEEHLALSYGLWLWITLPGLFEVALRDKLIDLGADVELWPFGDAYDLHVTKGGLTWRLDAKVWKDTHGLAESLRAKEASVPRMFIVIPDHLKGFVQLLEGIVGPLGWKVLTEGRLLTQVAAA
ncbi:hypothetical protein SMIR_05005 [Streptomyces mirabilis]|uniref:restriction endonuclease-related protein n=1 Tax=Streptomyces mirabilis TaxID=68239 RepID=UPI001BAF9C44|nr:hypothetical protein [Streptomyces mirabilis]QUW78564.1 hypothetical protein SMIR_05005 [Streptomyces mirabilis]